MQRYSIFNILRQLANGNSGWQPAWRQAEPRKKYDVVIVGGGGHGLATAYYLAKLGVRRIAVLEKGWIGGGNSGRNTQIIRSNYFHPAISAFYDRSLRLYEDLGSELNFNIMLSQRGYLHLAHSERERTVQRRLANSMRMSGVQIEEVTAADIRRMEPLLNPNPRFAVVGGLFQARAAVARHDAVVWGYARAASALGVDIIQGCEVSAFEMAGSKVTGVRTSRGHIAAGKIALCVAGHSTTLARLVGIKLPIRTISLQAMVTEPVKPALNTIVLSLGVGAYVSQSDRGEIVMGGGPDPYLSYAQRGAIPAMRTTLTSVLALFPSFSRLRLMRQWAGGIDVSADSMPILGMTPVDHLYISGGWGTGGFKAIPAGGEALAQTIANNKPPQPIEIFALDRFARGAPLNESALTGNAQ